MELLLVLGVPFAGGIVLGFWGHRNFAPELNSGMSLLTFVAAAKGIPNRQCAPCSSPDASLSRTTGHDACFSTTTLTPCFA